jgi:hypothetical protein
VHTILISLGLTLLIPPKLSVEERRQFIGQLKQGPVRHRYRTQLWTLGRVAEVIELHFGVTYHPSQLWRILLSLEDAKADQGVVAVVLPCGGVRTVLSYIGNAKSSNANAIIRLTISEIKR